MSEEPDAQRPWNEQEWERFMQRSDARSAKFGELLETLRDHPDRDAIIAREMGWDLPGEHDGPDIELPDWDDIEPDEQWEEHERRHREALEAIAAYSEGHRWGLRVHDLLRPLLEASPDSDPQDPLQIAFADSLLVAAKIAAGHGMGYDDDVLCGNIVCCKRALAAAQRSLAALEELDHSGVLPRETLQPLIEEGNRVRRLVEEHIAELRARVWWQ